MDIESIKELINKLPQYELYVSDACSPEDGRPDIYSVGPFDSEGNHHWEDTIAEFWTAEHDGKLWAEFFSQAPDIIKYLLKKLDEKNIPSSEVLDIKLSNGTNLKVNTKDLVAVNVPQESRNYGGVYVLGINMEFSVSKDEAERVASYL